MTISISITRKVNTGDYENAEVYLGVRDIHPGSTEDEIRAMIEETGGVAFSVMVQAIDKKLKAIRAMADERML